MKTMYRKRIILLALAGMTLALAWYLDLWHRPVEPIDELIGQNLDYACKLHYDSEPDTHYEININEELNEFHGGIYDKKSILKDSLVQVYTWVFVNHKETIWVGKTASMNTEVIDAIRYKSTVRF